MYQKIAISKKEQPVSRYTADDCGKFKPKKAWRKE